MGNDSTSRTLVLLVGLAIAAWLVWLAWEAIVPFLIAFILAAALDPLVGRLQARGLPRWAGVLLVFGAFFSLLAAAVGLLLPAAIKQALALVPALPGYLERAVDTLTRWMEANAHLLAPFGIPASPTEALEQYREQLVVAGQAVVRNVVGLFQAAGSRLLWVVVLPVATLYALADWNLFRARFLHVVPPAHRGTVLELAARVSRVFVAYVRGLAVVSSLVFLVTWFLQGLVFQLPYALVIALVAGALYAVPYIGTWTALAVIAVVGWATGQSGGLLVGAVLTQLVVFQAFDSFVTPRVVGSRVGIHPLTGLFALAVGAMLFGLVGMILAAPVAASAKVIAAHFYPRISEPLTEGPEREYRDRSLLPRRITPRKPRGRKPGKKAGKK